VKQNLTWLDSLLQSWRIWMASRFIPNHAIVADIGSWDAALFTTLKTKQLSGFAIDPLLPKDSPLQQVTYLQGLYPEQVTLDAESIDVVTLLAVMEHIPLENQPEFASACLACLKPGGKVIMTVPAPAVDKILVWLKKLRLIKGMETGQHYGLNPELAFQIFKKAGFSFVFKGTFQAGLNNLFVFKKPA